LLAVLVEKCDPDREWLAGKSTLNRLELTPSTASAKARYKKIVADHAAVDRLFVEVSGALAVLSVSREFIEATKGFEVVCNREFSCLL